MLPTLTPLTPRHFKLCLLLLTLTTCALMSEHALSSKVSATPAAMSAASSIFANQVVTSTADGGGACPGANCTLRDAIAAVGAGETITFAVTGTITLASELAINKSLTIQGPGANLLTISGNNAVRVFNIGAGSFDVTLSSLTIANGRVSDAVAVGGGISNSSTGTLNIINSTLTGNRVSGGFAAGGGIDNFSTGTLNIINSTFTGNSATASGGGGSNVGLGGGIDNNGGTVNVTNSTLMGNSATSSGGCCGRGGGINNSAGTVNVTNSTLMGNAATSSGGSTNFGEGGGIYNNATATVNVTNSTLTGNAATSSGGGGSFNLGEGGGIYNLGTVNVTNSTLTGNAAASSGGTSLGRGGGINNNGGTVNTKNTIIAKNTATTSTPDVFGTFTTQGYNLIGDNSGSTGFTNGVNNDQVGSSALPLDPLLGPLQNNGGPTFTHALLPGSPAIDKGSAATDPATGLPLTTDQRSFPRPVDMASFANATGGNGSDIGAFEAQLSDLSALALGPGSPVPSTTPLSDQKAGSVLFFNYYSSSPTNASAENTRLNLTNTDPLRSVVVHLFFVDGSTCSPADAFVCLTPNQTISFLASDFDPGTSGYMVAVAVDQTGCPLNFNFLIGDEFLKLSSGHTANLGAEAFAAISNVNVCAPGALTATLNFDGVNYNAAPRVLALDNFPSPADGNNTLLILNRLGGNLAVGASTIGSLFGVLYDEAEQPFSFTLSAPNCQFKGSLASSVRIVGGGLSQVVGAGRSGWLRFWAVEDRALLGVALILNSNPGSNSFSGGHNLHKLTLTTTASLTIPIIVPGC